MKVLSRLGLPGLLLAVALIFASCAGGDGSGQQEDGGFSGDAQEESSQGGDMQGMDHSEMSGMEGMEGDSTDMEEMARQMVAPNGEYSDATFVDAMVPHHEGAVAMAEVALENVEHEEIRTLAQDIVDAQRAEIELFGEIREELGGEAMIEMSEEEMEGMMGNMDAGELAQQRPFDKAFIDAMIPHHESAIAMANVALQESEDPEVLRIAGETMDAQEAEIEQMKLWRAEWYPESHRVAPGEG
jgi:uncharacterized protein (DUF305 family)